MKAYLINMHLLVPRSRSTAKVKVKYKGYISKENGIHVSQTHLILEKKPKYCYFKVVSAIGCNNVVDSADQDHTACSVQSDLVCTVCKKN